jgi:hypothetical protein
MSKRANIIRTPDGIYVRQSALGQYNLCPASTVQDGTEVDGATPATTFGTAFHFHPEEIVRQVQLRELPASTVETTLDRALQYLDLALELDGMTWEDTGWPVSAQNEMASELLYAIELFDREIAPHIPWGKVEAEAHQEQRIEYDTEMELRYGNGSWWSREYDIYLTGTPDLLHWGRMEFWDWKTAARGWHERRHLKEPQSRLYPWLADPLFNDHDVTFNFVVYNKEKEQWDVHPSITTWGEREAWVAQARRTVRALLAPEQALPYKVIGDGFVAGRNWFCKPTFCPRWNTCEGKHLFDDGKVNLGEIRTLTW